MPQAPPVIAVEHGRGGVFIVLAIVAALAGVAALFLFDPARHGFYPRCFFKAASGLDCPGCGGLRATHQLLHGKIRAAFVLNPLFVVALPLALLWAARALAERLTGRKWRRFISVGTAAWMAGATVVLFGVLRNLPWRAWLDR